MMRITLAAAVVIAVMAFDPRPVRAYEAPWCAVINIGTGNAYWDCQYRTFEECAPNVLAGNRGFCNRNPRWEGSYAPVNKPKSHRKRHAQQH
jgi:Protein of unknown function (DUF3551)